MITSLFPLLIVVSALILNEKRLSEKKIQRPIDNSNEKEKSKINENHIENSVHVSDEKNDMNNNINASTTEEKSCSITICDFSSGKENKEKNQLSNNFNHNQDDTSHTDENELGTEEHLKLFWFFIKTEKIYKPVIFIFFYMITPSYGDAMFFFYTNELKFNPLTIGRLKLVYGIASIIGIYSYNTYFKETSFKKIILVTTILSCFFNMLSIILVERINVRLGIPDYFFCLATDALTTALSEINFLPVLVLACNLCPKNIEATLYAFLISIVNLSYVLSNQIGSGLTYTLGITKDNFSNFKWLIIIANISMLLPMPILYLINDNDYIKKEEKINNQEKNSLQVDVNTLTCYSYGIDDETLSLVENKFEKTNLKSSKENCNNNNLKNSSEHEQIYKIDKHEFRKKLTKCEIENL